LQILLAVNKENNFKKILGQSTKAGTSTGVPAFCYTSASLRCRFNPAAFQPLYYYQQPSDTNNISNQFLCALVS